MRKTQYILPIVVGIMSGMILQTFGEQGIHAMYPPPMGISIDDKSGLEAYITGLPTAAFLLLLTNYAVCALIAGIGATLISGRTYSSPAIVVSCALTLAGTYTIVLLPHQPLWFSALSLLANLLFPFIGYLIARKK